MKKGKIFVALIISIFVLAGCKTGNTPTSSSQSSSSSSEKGKVSSSESTQRNSESNSNCNKPIGDSTKAVEEDGCKVKGINDWEGVISGVPARGSKFIKLKIGMSPSDVMHLIGVPTASGSHITGKAFIPFYHGSDKGRLEYVYKHEGRLLFATSAWGANPGLIWIIHNSHEPGTL